MSNRWKATLAIIIGAVAFGLTFYTDLIRTLPTFLQFTVFVIIAAFVFYSGNFFDFIKEVRENEKLRSKNAQLEINTSEISQELSSLQKVIVQFLEHSEVYRQKIEELLKLHSEYLCIIKSSEGLGEVFKLLSNEEKEKFPFGSVLKNIPGSVEPFERAGMFLIPRSSLPGITQKNIKEYIDKVIIPEVKRERQGFLARLPKRISSKADEFSYKYIAFFLKPESMVYDSMNKKFKREFLSFMVSRQSDASLQKMKTHLEDTVKTKDILSLVDWSFFAKLTKEQKVLLDKAKDKINEKLQEAGFVKLSDFYEKSEEDFYKAVRPIFASKRVTKKKTENFSKKIIAGARETIDVLKKNGISL